MGMLPGVSYGVTGTTAGTRDWKEMMKSSLRLVFGLLLTFGFLLLPASFCFLVIAANAVVLSLLAVAAAYGVVVAVFRSAGARTCSASRRRFGRSLAAAVPVRDPRVRPPRKQPANHSDTHTEWAAETRPGLYLWVVFFC
jgi:uncharacterized membrane protein YdfJ with MMPL/SSD domain